MREPGGEGLQRSGAFSPKRECYTDLAAAARFRAADLPAAKCSVAGAWGRQPRSSAGDAPAPCRQLIGSEARRRYAAGRAGPPQAAR